MAQAVSPRPVTVEDRVRSQVSLCEICDGERGEIFCTRPDRPWGRLCLIYNEPRVSFTGVKRPGRGIDYPPPSSAEVKERVELYLYSPAVPSWLAVG